MKRFITFCVLLTSGFSYADSFRSSIHAIEQVAGKTIIKFENGRVAFTNGNNKSRSLSNDDVFEVQVDPYQTLISALPVSRKDEKFESANENLVNPPVFEPTVIDSYAEATAIFNALNPNYKRASECSNRAHVWSNDLFKKNGIKSEKAFVFFTATYITRTRSKWWFHVAPLLTIREGRSTQKRVMDYMFNRRPLTYQEWTDQFVISKSQCLLLINFSDYDLRADQTLDCYYKIGTMYDWMPTDFSAQERGVYKSGFIQSEINAAYSEAF